MIQDKLGGQFPYSVYLEDYEGWQIGPIPESLVQGLTPLVLHGVEEQWGIGTSLFELVKRNGSKLGLDCAHLYTDLRHPERLKRKDHPREM